MTRIATLRLALGYAAIAAAWVLLSDTPIYRFWPEALDGDIPAGKRWADRTTY